MIHLVLAFAAAAVAIPGSLKVEGVPPVPQELADELGRYTETRSALIHEWHPQRRELLISTRFGNVPHLHRVAMPGGARTQLTFGRERSMGGNFDPVNGERFLFRKDTGGGEFYQIYLYEMKTGRTTLLTDGSSLNAIGDWSPDGKQVIYTSTRRNRKDSDFWIMDPASPASARLLMQVDTPGWSFEDWRKDGKRVLVSRYKSADTQFLYEVDVQTGQRTPISPEQDGLAFGAALYTPDGKSAYLLTNQDSDFDRLAVLDLATRKPRFLRPDLKWDVTSLDLSTDGKFLSYVVNEDGNARLHVLSTATGEDVRLPTLPPAQLFGVQFRENSHELGFTMMSARSAADVYSLDVDTGKLERWTFSEIGGLNADAFVEPELIRWKSFDGRMISGFLYKPPARFSGPRPVVIDIHGGPEGQSRPGFLGRSNYYLNELGVALIYPNVRGSSGYGKSFLNLDNAEKREDSVKDIGALLDWIAARPDLDAKRVAVSGGSYGGYMTLASMTHYNDRLRCGIDWVGIANWVTFLERTEAYRRDLRRAEYGDERDPKMREFLTRISPVNNAHKITKPMLIVQGRNDPRVPYTESEQIVEAIRKNGGPVWYVLAADEGHGFSKKPNQDYAFAAEVLFLREHLLK